MIDPQLLSFASITSFGRCNESMIFVYSHTIIDDVRRTIIPSARVNKDPHGTSSRSLRNRESKPRRERDVVERVRKKLEDSSESLYPQHTSIHRWACKYRILPRLPEVN
jgi:hypothetical protein